MVHCLLEYKYTLFHYIENIKLPSLKKNSKNTYMYFIIRNCLCIHSLYIHVYKHFYLHINIALNIFKTEMKAVKI